MHDQLECIKEQFIETARRAYHRRIRTGSGSNISVRVPGEELMIVTPSGFL
jgi:ribulose-5-phosphate 4-epimerase/fuculose-1-phosphate aldolase